MPLSATGTSISLSRKFSEPHFEHFGFIIALLAGKIPLHTKRARFEPGKLSIARRAFFYEE
jgi:hypothetical protein